MHLKSKLIIIQQDATIYSLFGALHSSAHTYTSHADKSHLYVTPLFRPCYVSVSFAIAENTAVTVKSV
jgi:hypothetical protein